MSLHPAAKEFLRQLAASEAPSWMEMPPEKSREVFGGLTALWGSGPECFSVDDMHTSSGVPCRVYRPVDEPLLPATLYFHGGGWVLGNIETHDSLCRRLAIASQRSVISVDYRLAPEHRYPAAVDDCYDALLHVCTYASAMGIAPQHIAVAGDSAGGNLAAAVALRARDESGPKIESQVLIYPVIEPDFESPTYTDFATGYSLTRESMMWFWEQYLGSHDPEVVTNAKLAALANQKLQDMPKTFMLTAEYDVLRSEAEFFAKSLKAAGVAVRLKQYEGMLHGFVHLAGIFGDGLQALSDVGDFLKSQAQ